MYSSPRLWGQWLQQREEGCKRSFGYTNRLSQKFYNCMKPSFSWNPIDSVKHTHHGGIFNLEFSPDGSLLIAATERKSILVFDPLNHQLVNSVDQAHSDCVNYARFLDSRMFATCSDDTTIALWDVRYLKHKIRSLKGHSNWVKNIEYASKSGLLVTSGFDGSVYTWDINGYSEGDVQFQRVFHTNGLMRMRLTPDSSKMVICTTGGFLMVVHDLDFDHLAQDLQGFKPNMYRLIQMGNSTFPIVYNFNHLFTAKRNRVELISDFPIGNEAEVISSLQIHPHGWCALSRNTSTDENSEWTCVHDIQETGDREELGENCDDQVFNEYQGSCDSGPEEVLTGSSRTEGRHRRDTGTAGEFQSEDSFSHSLRERPVVHIQFNYGTGTNNNSLAVNSLTTNTGMAAINSDASGIRRVVNLDHIENWSQGNNSTDNASVVNRTTSENDVHTSTESIRFGNIELRISRRRNHQVTSFTTVASPSQSSSTSLEAPLSTALSLPQNESTSSGMDISLPQPEIFTEASSSSTTSQRAEPFTSVIRTGSNIASVVEGADLSEEETRRIVEATAANDDLSQGASSAVRQISVGDASNQPEVIIRETFFIRTGRDVGARTYLVLGPSRSYNNVSSGTFRSTGNTNRIPRFSRWTAHGSDPSPPTGSQPQKKIHKNKPRLTHFAEEPNVGRGFIKELCFSSDGRLVCSPYGYGVRLLTFNPECSELSDCVPVTPARLYELSTNLSHTNYVVSTKFSPVHCLLVSGCLSGKISFHQPVL